jgi:hypothetical protein
MGGPGETLGSPWPQLTISNAAVFMAFGRILVIRDVVDWILRDDVYVLPKANCSQQTRGLSPTSFHLFSPFLFRCCPLSANQHPLVSAGIISTSPTLSVVVIILLLSSLSYYSPAGFIQILGLHNLVRMLPLLKTIVKILPLVRAKVKTSLLVNTIVSSPLHFKIIVKTTLLVRTKVIRASQITTLVVSVRPFGRLIIVSQFLVVRASQTTLVIFAAPFGRPMPVN